ncbi:MAG: hypothetical protein RQ966_20875 [Acetobacteraceae bacterium]|nr:hypothetical protein [Acetobacteraceae bacterium]
MFTVAEVLLTAGIPFTAFTPWPEGNVFLTKANQLIGGYKDLCRFRDRTASYKGWQSHHVVETDDLHRLGVASNAPSRDDQLCVLLPERAHIGRINSILRRENPTKWQASGQALRRAYKEAYALVGDYCGAGEAAIQNELLAIVEAEFQKLGVRYRA